MSPEFTLIPTKSSPSVASETVHCAWSPRSDRRIDSIEILRDEVAAWQASRDRLQAKVNWQFTTDDARIKLKRLYPTLDE